MRASNPGAIGRDTDGSDGCREADRGSERGKTTFGSSFAAGRGTEGKLVICPTPIGNLGDMSKRAINALKGAHTVCAEDTRVTGKLLMAFGIPTRLERLDENVVGQRAAAIVERVANGEVIAYCTDAGMPGVSDPGQRLVAAAREAGVRVDVLPGPTAVSTAYVASGFTCPRFYFGGFFPRKTGEREAVLESLRALDAVLLFYESPHRLVDALRVVAQALPYRKVAVCRELTKLHEEVALGTAEELAACFAEREAEGGVKGEIVLVIDAPDDAERASDAESAKADATERAAELAASGMRSKQIAKQLATEFGISRNEAYDLALAATAVARNA
ncbi:MAG: 16S rRNA (cytidine(1402)-2'-O)-methyltransferase [Eggerthellaceae bacterium]|nr:16S rRNA (cytidine(1402)-2'-O)-methyltransferase [Eggerthellaceae bacterium]